MAVEYFLKIDGIAGESVDAKHKNEIEVQSFSWGEQSTITAGQGGGGGAGKIVPGEFHYASQTTKASPVLMLACATGEHIKKATLVARRPGKTQFEFLTMTFSEVRVSSYDIGSTPTNEVGPTDQVSLNFATLRMAYKVQKADGSAGQSIVSAFDFKANKKI
jgi:type VI secretion system secreted protein Hcp